MCGIVGLISRWPSGFYAAQEDIFKLMLMMDTVRGPDSTGCYGVSRDNQVEFSKGDCNGFDFVTSDVYRKFAKRMTSRYMIAIGHNRKATIGSVTPENAHPFTNEHITLVHNGTLHNADDLNKELEVDSMAIAEALAKHDAKAALKLLNGPFAIVWYDSQLKTLNAARNNGRPLSYIKFSDFWLIASEPAMPMWLTDRANVTPVAGEVPKSFEPLKIYTWHGDDLGKEPSVEPFEEYKWEAKATGGSHGNVVGPFPKSQSAWDQFGVGSHTFKGHTQDMGAGTVIALPDTSQNSSTKEPSWKVNETIHVKFDDDRQDSVGSTLFLGHPIVNGELHEDIVIHYVCPQAKCNEFLTKVLEGCQFSVLVESFSQYRSMPIVRVKDPIEVSTYKTKNGEYCSRALLSSLFKKGCERCMVAVPFEEHSDTIVAQRKTDMTWRVLCKRCIESSINEAQHRKQGGLNVVH